MKYCPNCGKKLEENQETCLNCGKIIKNTRTYSSSNGKSKVVAGVLGIVLGALGIHNFYLGYTGKALTQLLLSVLSFGLLSWISGIWGFVEGILILTGGINKDAYGNDLVD